MKNAKTTLQSAFYTSKGRIYPSMTFGLNFIAVVRQEFVMGINCLIFLYRNSFGANQRLALAQKSFRIAQVSHCAVQRV